MPRPSDPFPTGPEGITGTASVWEHDLTLVLQSVATAAQPLTRAEVSAVTELSTATSSRLVETLLAAHLLAEVDDPGAGPESIGLTLSAQGPAGLGLEVNVDYLAVCVADLRGEPRYREVRLGDLRGTSPLEVAEQLAELADRAFDAAARDDLRPVATTLAVPGLVDAASGLLRLAPNLGWRDVDLATLLRRHEALADLPLHIDNDANLASRAELATGETADSFLHITGEIGIGAGIVLDRRVFRGARGWSGELGHVTVHAGGRLCSCGARGCLEQYAGQDVLVRDGLGEVPIGTALGGGRASALLVDEARAGNPRLAAVLDEAGSALGIAIADAVNVLDVEQVVLGGIYAPLCPYLLPGIEREVRERLVSADWATTEVRPSSLGPEAAVLGAALVGVQRVLTGPAAFV